MFAQFFGGYLLNNGIVSADALAEAIEDKINTRMRLGVLAINAGLMTSDQVEHVNVSQQSIDKRFGDLAVDFGYLTSDDIDRLLGEQPSDYLLIGQALVNHGELTNAQLELAIKNYKENFKLNDDDISGNQIAKINKLVYDFYHFNNAHNARVYTDYVLLLFKNLIRFIGDDFTPTRSDFIKTYDAQYLVKQNFSGKFNAQVCIAAGRDEYLCFAERFSKEKLSEVNDFVDAVVGEFLNIINGLFLVNESNESGIELSLAPQEIIKNQTIELDAQSYCIPITFSFGEIEFIISVY